MANKKILLSDENAKVRESSTILVDDSTGKVSITDLKTTTLTFANNTGVLSASAGIVSSVNSATSGSILGSNGTNWQAVPSGTLYGDLSGSLSSTTVKSISNITSGTLGVANGGTGLSSPTANKILIGNGTAAVGLADAPTSGSVLKVSGSAWTIGAHPLNSPNIQYRLYLSSSTFSVPSGTSFVRCIVQAAGGGGGGGGYKLGANSNSSGGGGGGSGGLTDITIGTTDISGSTITITVGTGGSGANCRTGASGNLAGLAGSAGGNTSISYTPVSGSTKTYSAQGGGGGSGATAAGGVGGAGGTGGYGLTVSGVAGGRGGQTTATAPVAGTANLYGGAGGGGGGGGSNATPTAGASAAGGNGGTGFGIASSGGTGAASGNPRTNGGTVTTTLRNYGVLSGSIAPANVTAVLNAGGGGGGTASNTTGTNGGVGSNGAYGSGGGGGGAQVVNIAAAAQNGGNGGNGYVLIIYW
jgi:hypothetical protein